MIPFEKNCEITAFKSLFKVSVSLANKKTTRASTEQAHPGSLIKNPGARRRGCFFVAGNIEISNQLISDLLEFVEVAEELINANVIKTPEIISN